MSLAPDLHDALVETLPLLQRILITTDGTVTDMLAAAFREPILLMKLSVTLEPSAGEVPSLELLPGALLMHRRIVLKGQRTSRHYVFAETRIAADRLPAALRADLLAGRTPLGELWQSHRLETWKERPVVRQREAGPLSEHLHVAPSSTLVERAYRTFTGGKPVFHVTECFPTDYGVDLK